MICHSKLQPNGGLGNKIFVWSYGLIFSKINGCEHYTTNWVEIPIGSILRGQRKLRFYAGNFKSESIRRRLYLYYQVKQKQELILSSTDAVLEIPQKERNEVIYTFYKVAEDWHTAYDVIQPYRNLIIKELYKILTKRVLERLEKHRAPILSVHVRKGDFKKLGGKEILTSKAIATQTPNSFFKKTIEQLRKFVGKEIPVTIFTDGKESELKELLSMKNVKMVENDLDIVHLLLLSKSKIIVFSEGSTFSGWAGFLSEAILIRNQQHFLRTVRDKQTNNRIYEGCLSSDIKNWSQVLKNNLHRMLENKG